MREFTQPISHYQAEEIDVTVQRLFQERIGPNSLSLAERIQKISQFFIGRAYLNNALGEGPEGKFDQNPLYRFDVFDCVTFVNTVIALAKSYDLKSFRDILFHLAYCNGEVDYFTRNHFMSVDWNVNNAASGFVKDITRDIRDDHKRSLVKIARTEVNKPGWIQHKSINDLYLLDEMNEQQLQKILSQLHSKAHTLSVAAVETPYIPLNRLFDKDEQPIKKIWRQIPDACVIEIVRPDWNLKDKIGTNLNISHLGFVIRDENGDRQFRHASEIDKCVVDVSLIEYLQQRLHSPTIKGINLQAVY
ncbi:MAG: DUF1460 domain-containing protein [Gammaproteobacteria bacterium]|nr:DUF1460 domain-containing protein [Gammaproteobacteria bacterium]MCH9744564.1 DUF1460 domain-containing protein [Gammaproteobacteria bacterium]